MAILTVMTVLVILFEIWYGVAFLFAYTQLRERTLLLPVLQALLMLVAFAYLGLALVNGWQTNPLIVFTPLIAAMLVSVYWRRIPGGLALFVKSYPRGTLDVLAFRRPVADLKRRVRTK